MEADADCVPFPPLQNQLKLYFRDVARDHKGIRELL